MHIKPRLYEVSFDLNGGTAAEWANQQIGEMISTLIFELSGLEPESYQDVQNKRKMLSALVRRQNAMLDLTGADRIWEDPEHLIKEVEEEDPNGRFLPPIRKEKKR
jgi:hypothetical protein